VYSREFLNSESEPIKANEEFGSFFVEERMWGTSIFTYPNFKEYSQNQNILSSLIIDNVPYAEHV